MRILFAIGNRQAEEYLQSLLEKKNNERREKGEPLKNYEFVGYAVHKDNIIDLIKSKGPDILILREGLDGFKNIPPGSETNEVPEIFSFAMRLKRAYPNLRIIFLAGPRVVGDKNLGKLISFNIYDVLVGSSLKIEDVSDLIDKPNDFKDVAKYLPEDESDDLFDSFEKDEIQENKNEVKIDEKEFLVSEEPVPIKEEKEEIKAAPSGDVVIVAGENSNNKGVGSNIGSLFNNLMKQKKENKNTTEELPKKETSNEVSQKKTEQKEKIPPKDPLDKNYKRPINQNRQVPRKNLNIYTGKDKIVTFYGSKNGIGTTLVSFCVAMELALRKNKVLYIEYNDTNPMIASWLGVYEAVNYEDGIDRAILGYETSSLRDANNAITTKENLIKGNTSGFEGTLKKYPATLDMLFFSGAYLLRRDKEPISSTSFSQLLLYYMQQLNYNYIIVDVKSDSNVGIVEKALTFSNKNYIVISQELSSIVYNQQFFEELNRKGFDFVSKNNGNRSVNDKNSYIINRYSKRISLKEHQIREWLESKNTFTVPENTEEINELSLKCLPIMLSSKNREFKESISYIASDIETL